jgi:hypothetical protein
MPTPKVFRSWFFPSLSNRQRNTAIFVLVWVLSAFYLGMNLNRGWVPADEGILGQSAERVLHGELPHRDFDEPYTGGLAYLDAAAFRFFGVNLMVLRWVLFVFFLLWVPAVFALAREFCSAWPAAGATLLCVAWSVPNYPAAMPSWYCLFFATFGVLFLFRYLRTPHPAWLFVAGLCGGFSFYMKTPGLFYVAGVLLFLVFREQSLSRVVSLQSSSRRSLLYSAFVVFCLSAFLALLIRTVMADHSLSEFLHFVIPALALSALLLARERFTFLTGSPTRFRHLFRLVIPFLAGAALPILFLRLLYWRAGAFHSLVTNLFMAQLLRVSVAHLPPPHWIFELSVIPLALLLFQKRSSGRYAWTGLAMSIFAGSLLLLACRKYVAVLILTLNSARAALPPLTVAVAIILWFCEKKSESRLRDQQLMLLASVAAMTSLVQFPYASPLYFCYFATLALLTLVALLSRAPDLAKPNLLLVGVFFAVLAVFIFRPVTIAAFAFQKSARAPDVPLALPRAGSLRVFQDQADRYNALIPFIVRVSEGRAVLAGPDSPELYFLSGLPNHTPFFLDFFEPTDKYRSYLEQLLDRPGFIKVAVVNNVPGFSIPHQRILRALVTSRFPESRKFDNFEVFWRP